MARITAFSLRRLLRPLAGAREPCPDCGAAKAAQPAKPGKSAGPPVAREPERLERIAVYARAGYFNMGYTFEMFPLVGDLPPY